MGVLRQLNSIELSRAIDRLTNPIPGGKIEAARVFGIDLSLLIEQLKLSPAERSMRMHALAQGMESKRGSSPNFIPMLPYPNPAMSLEDSGYDIPPHCLAEADLQALSREFPPSSPNRRNLFVFSPLVESLVKRGSFSHLAQEVLGESAFAVRAIFFNKIEKANWHVPWHQDIGIPIRERRDVPGFSAFTRKDGILHVNAPSLVLEKLLIIRLHLDDCTASNGAMRLIPGSHLQGRIHEQQITPPSEAQPEVPAGGILRLRPLLLHASAHTRSDAPRRVVHIEYAVDDLPGGLEWATRVYPD